MENNNDQNNLSNRDTQLSDTRYDKSYNHNNIQESLPGDPGVIILGIVSIVICFCCGIGTLLGVVCSIIGIIWANQSLRKYRTTGESHFSRKSYSNLVTGRVLSIIGLCFSGLITIFLIVWFGFQALFLFGTGMFANALEQTIEQGTYEESSDYDEEPSDTWYYEEDEDTINAIEEPIIEEVPATEVPEATSAFEDQE